MWSIFCILAGHLRASPQRKYYFFIKLSKIFCAQETAQLNNR